MCYLSNMCYFCLEQTDNLINIDNSSSANAELMQALTYFGLNVYWSSMNNRISICEKCSSKLRDIFEFVSMCHKNNKIVQNHLLNNEKEINGSEAEVVLYTEDIAGTTSKIKLEKLEEDETLQYEKITVNSENITMNFGSSDIDIPTEENEETVAADTEQQCLIKHEIKIEHESLESPKASPANKELLVDQLESELDIKEEFSHYSEESKAESYTDNFSETQEEQVLSKARTAKLHKCTQCSKSFNWKSRLNRHLRVHTGERPYMCPICKRGFNIKCNLDYHMASHSGTKSFKCSRCPKSFVRKQNLAMHMRMHAEERPYKCSTCSKYFSTLSNLSCHARIHTGDKPFSCSICKRGFVQKTNLQTHLRIHTGEKPYKCTKCNKCYTRNTNLISHMRNAHATN